MLTRKENITVNMLREFKRQSIDDLVINRLNFLKGMEQAWLEDEPVSGDNRLYLITINTMIADLQAMHDAGQTTP